MHPQFGDCTCHAVSVIATVLLIFCNETIESIEDVFMTNNTVYLRPQSSTKLRGLTSLF